jgi:hypothetical protein
VKKAATGRAKAATGRAANAAAADEAAPPVKKPAKGRKP